MFIDGVDDLAKANPDVFLQRVTHAKVLANEMIARVILVSSEGSIMPILKSTSAMNRSTELIEIGDIPDDQAVQYLVGKGIKVKDAKQLVQYFGRRFVFLNAIVLRNEVFFKAKGIPLNVKEVIASITEGKIIDHKTAIEENKYAHYVISKTSVPALSCH